MNEIEFERELKKAKLYYFNIKNINCPQLDDKQVYFYKNGFNHLVRKGKCLRKQSDQLRRLRLLYFVTECISAPDSIAEQSLMGIKFKRKTITLIYFELRKKFKNRTVIVIIRKINQADLHFFSVMDK